METITVSLRVISIAFVVFAMIVLVSGRRLPDVSEWLLAAIWLLLLI